MGAALDIRGLTLRFGGITALDGLDLAVVGGGVLGVAGPNGSGKSSLINVLTGHYAASGDIETDGRPLARLGPADRARMGITRSFQTPRHYARMNLRDNLRAALHAKRPLFTGRAARRREDARIEESLALFGLCQMADALPAALTPFQLRLLELARCHVSDARLLLLDEPTVGATAAEAEALRRVMADHLLPGRTVLLIERRLDLLRDLCTDLLVLRAGRRIAFGRPAAVLDAPQVRACLTGAPAVV